MYDIYVYIYIYLNNIYIYYTPKSGISSLNLFDIQGLHAMQNSDHPKHRPGAARHHEDQCSPSHGAKGRCALPRPAPASLTARAMFW